VVTKKKKNPPPPSSPAVRSPPPAPPPPMPSEESETPHGPRWLAANQLQPKVIGSRWGNLLVGGGGETSCLLKKRKGRKKKRARSPRGNEKRERESGGEASLSLSGESEHAELERRDES